MSIRHEHVIVAMLEPVEIRKEFIDWPLHITIVPWFPCDDAKKLDKLLLEIAKRHTVMSVKVGSVEDFGTKTYIPVNLIDDNPELIQLHWDVFNTLEENGFPIHQKEHVGKGYRAHVTLQKHGRKNEGDELEIKNFTLVSQIRQKKTGIMVKAAVKNYQLT